MSDFTSSSSRPIVLVVDDDPIIRLTLQAALEEAGLTVLEAETGRHALSAFSETPPDLVLLDVMMPGMDGFATCTELRKLPGGHHTPVLIMTGLDDTASIAKAYEMGATDFITKPINEIILSERVRYMLRASQVVKKLAISEARLAQAQSIAQMGSWEWDLVKDAVHVSKDVGCLFGLPPQEFQGTREEFMQSIHSEIRTVIQHGVDEWLKKRRSSNFDHRLTLRDGAERVLYAQAKAILDENNAGVCISGTIQNITERKQAEDKINHLAYYDSLTGLPNRVLFGDRVTHALKYAERNKLSAAVLFLDLDRFKLINDSLGHTIGDLLLQAVAKRLTESVRQSDSVARQAEPEFTSSVARLGGDEFTIFLTKLSRVQDAATVARRILNALANPFSLDGHEIFITISIGIAVYPPDGDNVERLLKNADTAMYHAKTEGRNNYQFYSKSMNAMAYQRLVLEGQLHKAIERDELLVYYQPKVDMLNNRITGAEAVVRWQHPDRGLLPAEDFIVVAQEAGLIKAIDRMVLNRACQQNKEWQDLGLPPLHVAVNVSNSLFREKAFGDTVAHILRDSRLPSDQLELELTETIILRHAEVAIATLQQLKGLGVFLSIDDFGTGYSSLSYLLRLPIDTLKIDRSFVKNLSTDPDSAAIAKAIIAMGHSLNLRVLAEGVETEDQAAFLKDQGCDEMQGYLFSPPISAQAMTKLLQQHQRGHSKP